MHKQLLAILIDALNKNNINLTHATIEKLVNYLMLLNHWNRAFNLTAITEPEEMVYLHLIDSLTIVPFLQGKNCLDIGSGAGLPGIPLAIAYPEYHWTLLDKNSKKTRFQTQVIAELKLNNMIATHDRAENFHPTLLFDTIVSRAFGTLRLFTETSGHLLAPSGALIAMKGRRPNEELADIPPHFMIQQVSQLTVNGIDAERHVICIKKDS